MPTNALAEHSSVRGTDATGISFVNGGMIRIIKEAILFQSIVIFCIINKISNARAEFISVG